MFKKITTILCFVILLTLISIAGIILAYGDKTTHPALTDEVVDFYNITQGINKLDADDKYWIRQGSIDEDIEPRWIHHFYDPINNTGWNAKNYDQLTEQSLKKLSKIFLSNRDALSSKEWSQNEKEQEMYNNFGGNHTWQKAIRDYANGNKKEALYSLGHIIHLIEDSSVPDHTRNDTHPHFDSKKFNDESPYEMYTMRFKPNSNLNTATNLLKEGIKKSHRFSSLNEAFDYIANYSNNYFFSEDTINSGQFENPKILREDGEYGYGEDINNKKIILVEIKSSTNDDFSIQTTYSLKNNKVLSSYWSLLSRQAVITGSGIIDLFFQEVEKAKQNPELYSNNPKNQTNKLAISPFGKIAKVSRKVDFVKENIIEPNTRFWKKTAATTYTKTKSYISNKKAEFKETITSAYEITKREYKNTYNDYKGAAAKKIKETNEKTKKTFANIQKNISGSFTFVNQEAEYRRQRLETIKNWEPKQKPPITIKRDQNPFETWAINKQPPPTRIKIKEYVDYGGEEKFAAIQRARKVEAVEIVQNIETENEINTQLPPEKQPNQAAKENSNQIKTTELNTDLNTDLNNDLNQEIPVESAGSKPQSLAKNELRIMNNENQKVEAVQNNEPQPTAQEQAANQLIEVQPAPNKPQSEANQAETAVNTEENNSTADNSAASQTQQPIKTQPASTPVFVGGGFIPEEKSIITDNTPPLAPAITASGGRDIYTNQNPFTITGTKTADTAVILINQSESGATYPTATDWQFSASLQEGENTFNISARDKAKNTSQETEIKIIWDTTNPTDITDLAATSTAPLAITLNWSPSTESNLDYYTLKYATTTITQLNWDTITNYQNTTTTSLILNTLNSDQTYYFALKTKDKANNYSNISNTVSAFNASSPNPITDLSASPNTNSVQLSWTASSDPYFSSYLIKYSTTQITDQNFDAITNQQETTNNTLTINNLNLNTTYYFALKVKNTTGYYSAISNIISTQTTGQNYYPMYLVDKQHTNRSILQGPQTNAIKNTFDFFSPMNGTLVDYDKNIYLWNDKTFYIYDKLGSFVRNFLVDYSTWALGSAIDSQKNIYYNNGTSIFAVDQNGTQKWFDGSGLRYIGIYNDAPYASSNNCEARIYDKDGNILHSYYLYSFYGCIMNGYPAIDSQGNIYIWHGRNRSLYSYDQNGAYRWTAALPANYYNYGGVAVNDANGNIYLQSITDGVLVINAQDGSYSGLSPILDGSCPVAPGHGPPNPYDYSFVSVASDGSVIIGVSGMQSMVSYFDSNNTKQWTYCLDIEDIPKQPLFDSDNNIYVAITNNQTNLSRLISLDPNGNLRWQLNNTAGVFDRIMTDPVIADDNSLFFVGYDSASNVYRGIVVGE